MTHKLLLADASVTIQRVIELTFSGEDVEVVAVNDGEQAIARIAAERPDIVLADIGMPKRSGYDVAAFIKADPSLKHIPVLLMAGAFEPVDDALAAQAGCDGVLVKPFEPLDVISRVKALLDGAKGTPTRAIASVPRPVERLALRPDDRPSPPPDPSGDVIPPEPVIERDQVDAFSIAQPSAGPNDTIASEPSGADGSLDDYFARLDAAFAMLSGASTDSPDDQGTFDDSLGVPTLDELLGSDFGKIPPPAIDIPPLGSTVTPFTPTPLVAPPSVEPPDSSATRMSAPAQWREESELHRSPHSLVADAFSALLAVEQGDPDAAPVRLMARPAEPVISEAFIEEVVRRVVERISQGAAREAMTDIVSEVAGRLVREEIEQIRKRQ